MDKLLTGNIECKKCIEYEQALRDERILVETTVNKVKEIRKERDEIKNKLNACKAKMHEINEDIALLRQLVGESNEHIPDWVYNFLNKLAPLMTEEQKKELDEQLNKYLL